MNKKSMSSADGIKANSSQDEFGELQMSPVEMLNLANRTAELVIKRIQNLPSENAWDGDFRGELENRLLEAAPETGTSALEVIERAMKEVLPYALRLDHPRSFAFVSSSPTWPGILADFIASAYNPNLATWLTASGPSQLELVVIEWFRSWIGYPESAGGLLVSGGSAAALNAFVAAREAAGNPEKPTVYMSDQSHSAQVRAARIVGVSENCIRKIPVDKNFRLDLRELIRSVSEDRAAGFNPIAICANAGAAGNGAIDPLYELSEYCSKENIWLHVDAAYGGFALLTKKGKQLLRGIEKADSIGLDGHKWLFQPYEVGGLMVKDVRNLENTFAVHHDVLQDTIWGANHPNFSDKSYQLSRSFRALKVWMSIQTFGLAAFRRAVERGMDFADQSEKYIQESNILELLAPASLGIVCFRINPADENLNEDLIEEINRTVLARVFWEDNAIISSTLVEKKFALRLCIINHNTTWQDVMETLAVIEQFGKEELSKV
ncbi:MAG: aminotransferase class V-fold PLP-dependent enzyme [Rhodobacteraceae bacterium]|nr:aminotransferase class V-fold PLP-dependent enzyme [Paracoccaceae bacterium]MYG42546.1 aminotransferase class V-fold PLP-dependent enzyme [Paracoccaceae bacterium]